MEHNRSPLENMQQIYTRCINFYKNFDSSNENLFFFGKSGLGKTFLSNCIAKELLDMGKVVMYMTASELIEVLRKARFDESFPLIHLMIYMIAIFL